jgi:hypothetical protein
VSFRKILIAVDSTPLAVYTAELGIELASLKAEIAFVHAIEPGLSQAPGITPNELIAEAELDGRRLIAGFCRKRAHHRSSSTSASLVDALLFNNSGPIDLASTDGRSSVRFNGLFCTGERSSL